MEKMQPYPQYDETRHCNGMDMELFYEDILDRRAAVRSKTIHTLKETCNDCPFLDPCFNWAIHHEAHGFWAGTTGFERKELRKKLNILLVDPLHNVLLSLFDGRLGKNKESQCI